MAAKPVLTPAEILRKFYDAETIYMAAPEAERDFAGMEACLASDMMLHQSPDLPYGGVYEGIEGFKRWSEAMSSYFDQLVVENPQVFEKQDSDYVIVLSSLKLRARATGIPLELPLTQVVGVDREKGVIKEIRPFYWDVAALNKAVGR